MDEIIIKKIRLKGKHGCFAEEREEYGDFEVSIALGLPLDKAAKSDELSETIDYPSVIAIAESVLLGDSVRLIEKLADQIAARLFMRFENLEKARVKVSKMGVQTGYNFDKVSVEIERERSFYF